MFYTPGLDRAKGKQNKHKDGENEFTAATFADLVNIITSKTNNFKNGRLQFNVRDSTTVSRVMAEMLLRYVRMERKARPTEGLRERERKTGTNKRILRKGIRKKGQGNRKEGKGSRKV